MRKICFLTLVAVFVLLLAACNSISNSIPAASPTLAVQSSSAAPRFTHPAEITNPYYPVSLTGQAIFTGTDGGELSRIEVTLLPGTQKITWKGVHIEARIEQFVEYSGGKLVEIAYDYFAQADDGSVYYLGEDVSNYLDGKVVDHGGSWRAGVDGAPPALIMPARPQVGQVFKPENLPGVAYETDQIMSLTEKATTPAGNIEDGILVKEVLMDGIIEEKVYAPHFGIVVDRGKDELANLVLFNPTIAGSGSIPEPLSILEAQAEDIFDVIPAGNWEQVAKDVTDCGSALMAYKNRANQDHAPQPFQDALVAAVGRLQKTAAAKDAPGTLQASNDLSAAVVDLYAVYRPSTPPDLGRLDLLERQVKLDNSANDPAAAADSLAKISAVWARLKPYILAAQNGSVVAPQFDRSLADQQKYLSSGSASALTKEADNALELVDALEQLF